MLSGALRSASGCSTSVSVVRRRPQYLLQPAAPLGPVCVSTRLCSVQHPQQQHRPAARCAAVERSSEPASPPTTSTAAATNGTAAPASQQQSSVGYDLTIWHYKPWWCQPPMIILAGVLFIVGANVLTEPCLKTTVLAASPVALWWYIFLWVLPRSFKDFATDYIIHHPELQLNQQQPQNPNDN